MAGADERHGGPESDPEVAASELAASLLITSADLPGFVADSAEVGLTAVPGLSSEPLAQVHSSMYSGQDPDGTAILVGSAVSVLPSAASAERGFESYRSTLDSIKDAAVHEVEQAGIAAQISMSVIPTVSKGAVGIRSTVEPEGESGHLQFTDTMIFVRGPALVSLGLYSSGSPPSLGFEQRLIDVLMDRAARVIP